MKTKHFIFFLLALSLTCLTTACGGDDDDGGATAYTEAEIVELLTGKWEVYGKFKATYYNTKESFSDNYKGTIEFKAEKNVKFKVTEGTKYKYTYSYNGSTYDYEYYIEEEILNNSKYGVLKKNGKNYISFGSSSDPYNFEIVSLKKNTFMLKLDTDIDDSDNNSKVLGHVYMTIVSN